MEVLPNIDHVRDPSEPKEKVAVIGTGVAGLLAACELTACGDYDVEIFEASERVMSGTSSRAIQGHLGGLYSASEETAAECLGAAIEMKKAYPLRLSIMIALASWSPAPRR